MMIPKKQKAFTLIEILLYFAVISVIIFAILDFSVQIYSISTKSGNLNELEGNIDFIADKIIYSIKGAESIDNSNSLFNIDEGKISLNMPDPSFSPTIFYLENNTIYLKEGANPVVFLSSEAVNCPKLRFLKTTVLKAPDQITLDIVCRPVNFETTGNTEQLDIHTSISLRK